MSEMGCSFCAPPCIVLGRGRTARPIAWKTPATQDAGRLLVSVDIESAAFAPQSENRVRAMADQIETKSMIDLSAKKTNFYFCFYC
jgi:hypothetical protein